MTIQSLAHAFPFWHHAPARPLRAGLAVPPRIIPLKAELRCYLRQRRRAWRSSLVALLVVAASLASWAAALARLG